MFITEKNLDFIRGCRRKIGDYRFTWCFFLSPNIEVGQFAKEPESEETNKGALCLSNRAKPTFGGIILDNVQADFNSCFPDLCFGVFLRSAQITQLWFTSYVYKRY